MPLSEKLGCNIKSLLLQDSLGESKSWMYTCYFSPLSCSMSLNLPYRTGKPKSYEVGAILPENLHSLPMFAKSIYTHLNECYGIQLFLLPYLPVSDFPTKSWHSMVTSVVKICPVQGSLLWVMVQEAILQTRACLCWICRSSLFISQYASSVLLLDIESQSPACASFCHFCFSFRKTWASARTGFNKGWFSFGTYPFICGLMTLQHRKLML